MLGFVFRRKRSSGENGDSRERRSAGEGGNGGSVAFSSWGGKRSVAGGDPLNRVVRQADINNLRRLARSTSFSAWGGKKWNMTRSQFYNNYYTNWKSQAWLSLILLSALNIPAWYSINTRHRHCWQERQSPSCLFCPHTDKRRIMRRLLMTSPSQRWISDINDSLRGNAYHVKHDRSLHGNSRIYILNPIQTLLLFNTSIEEDFYDKTDPTTEAMFYSTTLKVCILFMWQTEGTEQKYLINLKRRQMSSETFVCPFWKSKLSEVRVDDKVRNSIVEQRKKIGLHVSK